MAAWLAAGDGAMPSSEISVMSLKRHISSVRRGNGRLAKAVCAFRLRSASQAGSPAQDARCAAWASALNTPMGERVEVGEETVDMLGVLRFSRRYLPSRDRSGA